MGLPKILFNIATTGLGLLSANIQKTPGLVITGVTVATKITLGQSVQVFSLQDAADKGITAAENPFAYKHVQAFYNYAGNGAELWLMLVSDATSMENMADKTMNYAKKLLGDANGRIRILGIVKESLGSEVIADGLDADVDKAAIKAQDLAEEAELNYFPIRVLISANSFNGTPAALKDYKTTAHNKVSLLISNTDGAKDASIGLALGRLASTPVQRNIGRVKDGPVEDTAAFFTNGATAQSLSSAWDSIHDKGFIILRNFAGRSGFYFSDDPTLTAVSDDFRSLANGFVMDKALMIAYSSLIENLGDEVLVTDEGTIHPAIIKSWQNEVETQLQGLMVANGELSNARVYINERQDVLTTGNMTVAIQLLPVGYAKYITVDIGFTTQIN
ncbi:hypothetical protein EGI11_03275 [Chryseobacterium sp. H3056]|uniref:DUF2586 family protein n=1 Tax=Kaistella daneshvariae TaxID=2487074 RepID=A0A3N0X1B4_9FLAO|nr:DUF2586 family protein [Kaistella daneshvariae]ROI10099.1 hypothetical protein EGI11_03275 [Kaistella daneshvariae]